MFDTFCCNLHMHDLNVIFCWSVMLLKQNHFPVFSVSRRHIYKNIGMCIWMNYRFLHTFVNMFKSIV